MKTLTHPADLDGFRAFRRRAIGAIALDTETTGLDVYAPEHRGDRFRDAIRAALRQSRRFVAHNATFDLLVIDRHLGVTLEELVERTGDTRILAHLLDPPAYEEDDDP